jgi:hypothetical protein
MFYLFLFRHFQNFTGFTKVSSMMNWYFMILLAKFNLTAAADRPTLSFLERALSSLLLQGQGRLSGRVRDEVEFPKCK